MYVFSHLLHLFCMIIFSGFYFLFLFVFAVYYPVLPLIVSFKPSTTNIHIVHWLTICRSIQWKMTFWNSLTVLRNMVCVVTFPLIWLEEKMILFVFFSIFGFYIFWTSSWRMPYNHRSKIFLEIMVFDGDKFWIWSFHSVVLFSYLTSLLQMMGPFTSMRSLLTCVNSMVLLQLPHQLFEGWQHLQLWLLEVWMWVYHWRMLCKASFLFDNVLLILFGFCSFQGIKYWV